MINKQYLYQLYRSKRYLLFFILMLYLLFALSEFFSARPVCFNLWQLLVTLVAAYVLPMLVLSYVHDRKAIDCYGSLPLSRKEMLATALLFCNLSIIVPLSLAFLLSSFLVDVSLAYWLTMCLGVVVLVGFNASVYLLANSVFDGLVMVGAYTFLPLYLGSTIAFFLNTFVYGYRVYVVDHFLPLTLPANISFLYSYFEPNYLFGSIAAAELTRYYVALIGYGVLAYLLLWHGFKQRKLERAYHPSDGFFAYPFIINSYALMSLLMATSNIYEYDITNWADALQYLFFYIFILALYVIANFIYKKRLYLSLKSLALFAITVLVSLGLCFAANSSYGFGLAYKFGPNEETYSFELYNYNDTNDYIRPLFEKEGIVIEEDYFGLNINTQGELTAETLSFLNELRLDAIDRHYHNELVSDNNWTLQLRDGVDPKNYYAAKMIYSYSNIRPLSLDELVELSYNETFTITIDCYKNLYELRNGKLVVIDSYIDSIYYD